MVDTAVDVTDGLDLSLTTKALASQLFKDGKALSLKHATLLVQAAKHRAKVEKARLVVEELRKKELAAVTERKKIEKREAAKGQSKKDRKSEDRYKKLLGIAVIEARKLDPKIATWVDKVLNKHITRDSDRIFLGLAPLESEASKAEQTENEPAESGPLCYPVCCYANGAMFGAYLHDFPKSSTTGSTADEAFSRAKANVLNALSSGQSFTPSDAETASRGFETFAEVKLNLHKVPEFSISWVTPKEA